MCVSHGFELLHDYEHFNGTKKFRLHIWQMKYKAFQGNYLEIYGTKKHNLFYVKKSIEGVNGVNIVTGRRIA